MSCTVVFDFDGTLADTKELHAEAFEKAAKLFGVEIRKEDFYRYFGLRGKEILEKMGVPKEKIPLILRRKAAIALNLIKSHLKLKEKAVNLLRRLRKRGLRVAIFSSSRASFVHEALKVMGLLEDISFVVAAEDVTKGKPDPEGLERIKKTYPEVIAYIGDTAHDRAVADAAGVKYFDVNAIEEVEKIVKQIEALCNGKG